MKDTMIIQWATGPGEDERLVGEAGTFIRRTEPHGYHVIELADGSQVQIHPENTLPLPVADQLYVTEVSADFCEELLREYGMPGDRRGGVTSGMTAAEKKQIDAIWAKMSGSSCWWDAFNIVRLARMPRAPHIREMHARA